MKPQLQCCVCSVKFKSAKLIDDHFNCHNQSEIKRFQCEFCDLQFIKEISLTKHCSQVHQVERHSNKFLETEKNVSEEKPEVFLEKCTIDGCSKSFSHKVSLNLHIQCVHSDERNFQCHICPSSFKTVSNLNVHMKMHKNQRDHICEMCSKAFYTASHLKDHQRIHENIARFKCQFEGCEKSFIHASSFKKHQNYHNGLKNYECSVCRHKFAQNCHLRDHMRIHSNVKDHACSTCQKSFRRADTLRIHQQVHERRKSETR